MDKSIFKSKTMWGFGLAALIAVAQMFGIGYSDAVVTQLIQVLSALFGTYGLRDAVSS
jgi:hypothetical protein